MELCALKATVMRNADCNVSGEQLHPCLVEPLGAVAGLAIFNEVFIWSSEV